MQLEPPVFVRPSGPAHWHLDVRGHRAGPYPWTVVLELARSGGLGPDDLVWCPELTDWKRTTEFPELADVLLREREVTLPPIETRKRDFPRLSLAGGLAWTVMAYVLATLSWLGWANVQDGVLAAQLQVFVPLTMLALGVFAVRALWIATRPSGVLKRASLRGAARGFAAVGAAYLILISLSVFINARDIFYIAIGSDPLGHAELRVLPGATELEVRGLLGAGTASQLAQALAKHPGIRFLHLNSPGGWLTEGERMASLIRAHRLGTYTATGCYSACVLAFVAGSPRVLHPEARLGLHSVSGAGTDPLFIQQLNAIYQADLRQVGASERFVELAIASAPTDLWMPQPPELKANHVLDLISDAGFSASGEPLTELARQATEFEDEYPFMQLLARADRKRFAQLDRTIRLALRRGAESVELEHYATDLATQIELQRIPRVSDQTVGGYMRELQAVAQRLSAAQPQQCVAVLARNHHDLAGRSAATVRELDPALERLLRLERLLSVPLVDRPPSTESDAQTLSKLVAAVGTGGSMFTNDSSNERTKAVCARLLSMFDLALHENMATQAAFLRALRNGAGAYLSGSTDP
jgi:hypothetical protein